MSTPAIPEPAHQPPELTLEEQWAAYWTEQQQYAHQQQWAAYWAMQQQQQWAAYQAALNPPSNNLSIIAMVLGGLAVLFLPILLGPAAIICAAIAKGKDEPLATRALWAASVGTVLGLALSVLVFIYVLR